MAPKRIQNRPKLTASQQNVLQFVKGYVKANGYAPSLRDVAGGVGVSVAGARVILVALTKKSYVRMGAHAARAIVVLPD